MENDRKQIAEWKNYAGTYTPVSKDALIEAMRKADFDYYCPLGVIFEGSGLIRIFRPIKPSDPDEPVIVGD